MEKRSLLVWGFSSCSRESRAVARSTQSKALKRRLSAAGYTSTLVHEPGGTPTGERIRRWLKTGSQITPMAELLLFSAARTSLVETVIRPALERDEVVISDRYIYSTVAYQSYGRKLDIDLVRQLNRITAADLAPRLVILLDLPPQVGISRKAGRPLDRFEREDYSFLERVRQGYLKQSEEMPDQWLVLPSSEPKSSIENSIWARVSEMLPQAKSPES